MVAATIEGTYSPQEANDKEYAMKSPLSIRTILVTLLLGMGQAHAFVLLGSKWGDSALGTSGGTVTYSFAPEFTLCGRAALEFPVLAGGRGCRTASPDTVFGSGYEAIFDNAFDSWSQLANIDFLLVPDSGGPTGSVSETEVGQIRIGAARFTTNNADAFSILMPGGRGLESDIFISSNFGRWDPAALLFLALHEIGHSIGLGHSFASSSVMSSGFGSTSITDDDIAGIQTLYGVRAVPEPESFALVLAGLVLIGAASRRNRPAFSLHGSPQAA